MQQAAGYSPSHTSLCLLPLALSAAGVSLGLSAPLTRRYGPRNVLVASLLAMAAAMLLATRLPENPDYLADILPVVLLLGVGGGLGLPAVMTIAMSVESPADAGLASGLAGTSGMIGDALGVATLIGIAAAHSKSLLGRGAPVGEALSSSFHLAFGIGAAITGAAIAIGILMLRSDTQPRAQRSPEAG
jgi:nitrate/nitrite transporter NarK